METLHASQLQRLLAEEGELLVTIYLPMQQSGREVRQNAILFKNLLSEAREQLDQTSQHIPIGLREQLDRAEGLIQDNEVFWRYPAQGLAVFISEHEVQMLQLPAAFRAEISVGPQFAVSQLLPLLQGDGVYYIVAVSQNDARLLMGTRDHITEIPADLPESLAAVVGVNQKGFFLHSFRVRQGAGNGSPAVPHGHETSDHSAELKLYFREIDKALQDAIENSRVPLVFAGVKENFPIYQEVNSHPGLVDQPITGNPDRLSPGQLHQQAWPLVEPLLREPVRQAIERYNRNRGTDLTRTQADEILEAARQGQVDFLLVDQDWLGQNTGGSLDSLIREVLQTGGAVWIVNADEQMPGDTGLAALLRYTVDSPTEKDASSEA